MSVLGGRLPARRDLPAWGCLPTGGGLLLGGICLLEGSAYCCLPGGSLPNGDHPVNRMTESCKNITFPQLHLNLQCRH